MPTRSLWLKPYKLTTSDDELARRFLIHSLTRASHLQDFSSIVCPNDLHTRGLEAAGCRSGRTDEPHNHLEVGSSVWSIASAECGEIPSSTNPGISGDDTVSICISST